MPSKPMKKQSGFLKSLGRILLQRMESSTRPYEKRIVNNMTNLKKVIQVGDVMLVEGRSEVSRIIQVLTQSSWSHIAMYVGDKLIDGGNDIPTDPNTGLDPADRDHVLIEADAGNGVIVVPINKYRDYNIRICRPYGITAQDLDKVVDGVASNLGKHYDHENILDLALMLLPAAINPFKKRTIQACLGGCSDYKVICSGMIAKAFQSVGYPIVPALLPAADLDNPQMCDPYGSKLIMRHFSQIVPRDFDLSPNFEIIKYNIIGLGQFDYRSIWAHKH